MWILLAYLPFNYQVGYNWQYWYTGLDENATKLVTCSGLKHLDINVKRLLILVWLVEIASIV